MSPLCDVSIFLADVTAQDCAISAQVLCELRGEVVLSEWRLTSSKAVHRHLERHGTAFAFCCTAPSLSNVGPTTPIGCGAAVR